jgi:hypothetical protein
VSFRFGLAAIVASIFATLVPTPSVAAVSSIQITVPNRPTPKLQISAVKITLELNNSSPIALSVSGPSGTRTTGLMTLTSASNDCFGSACFTDFDSPTPPAVASDTLIITKPMQAGADPASAGNNKIVLFIQLLSNLDEANSCVSTMPPGDETWTIDVVGGTARITFATVQSLDRNITSGTPPACSTGLRPIPLNDLPIATVVGEPAIKQGGRIGVDAVLVLDRSGSMSSPVSSGGGSKISRLQEAAGAFVDMWQTLRANEALLLIESPTDRLGVVFFDNQSNWLKDLIATSAIDGIKEFATLNLANEKTAINGVVPGGSTSIGRGLQTAAGVLTPAASEPNRKVVLLMSDGKQNTPAWAWANSSQVFAGPSSVSCPPPPAPPAAACTPLPNQPPIQIYSVTVGTGAAVDPTINQAIATASNGDYLNSEDDASLLSNFFVQVLQNSIKYSTVETMRVISDKTRFSSPFQTEVPVTSSTTSLAFSLVWDRSQGNVRVTFTPPGGGQPIVFQPASGATTGSLTGGIPLPLTSAGVAFPGGSSSGWGPWTIQIASTNDKNVEVPFNFMLLGDDAVLNSALTVERGEHAVGGKIKLTARINEIGQAIAGLNNQTNARVQVAIVRPGNNLGDVLSDSALTPPAGGSPDAGSAAQRKLDAILAANPNALVRNSGLITLVDNGDPAMGDDKADDGVYSALIPAEFEGHYNIVFVVEGNSRLGGRFVRQQIRTVHVRSLPDAGTSGYATNVIKFGDSQILVATVTPRNIRGGKMGPGWANYFWFSGGPGGPVKPVDNLNGTYTAQIPFGGANPPKVGLHFLPDPVVRTDDFAPGPGTLTPVNLVTADVGHPGVSAPGAPKDDLPWWVWLGLSLLLLLVLLMALVLFVLLIMLLIKLLRS